MAIFRKVRRLSSICCIGAAIALTPAANVAVGADDPCAACHADTAGAFPDTPHGRALGAGQCAVCHGDGAAHLASPNASTIRTFETEPPAEQNQVCGACHNETNLAASDAHSAADVACSTCHDVHSPKDRNPSGP